MQENNSFYYNELAIFAFTLSILSFIPLFGLEKSILAIVFGILALRSIKEDSSQKGKNLALLGIIFGMLYTLFILRMLGPAIEFFKKMAPVLNKALSGAPLP